MASPRHNDAPTPVAPPRWSEYPPARDIDDRASEWLAAPAPTTARGDQSVQGVVDGPRAIAVRALSARVETHRAEIMRRLAVTSVAELVRIGMRVGIVPTETQWSALA